jgi:hypothetical protein
MPRIRDAATVQATALASLALLLAVVSLTAQQPPPQQPPPSQQQPVPPPQQQFQFVISASDADGVPVGNLTPADVIMSEQGVPNTIVDVQPFSRPVKLTIAVDNGPASGEILSHYRAGLTNMVNALPPDMEVSLLTIAPQPRFIVQSSVDRAEILAGINRFAPESFAPRFTDTLVEFSRRFQDDLVDNGNVVDSVPVLVLVSTTAAEATSYEVPAIDRAFRFLRARRARLYIAMITVRQAGSVAAQINEGRQPLIAIPAIEFIGGTYEPLAISNRLMTLLPEWGEAIAALHRKYDNQWLVTVQRQDGLTGGLQEPVVRLAREGLTGEVSLDGLPDPPPYNP